MIGLLMVTSVDDYKGTRWDAPPIAEIHTSLGGFVIQFYDNYRQSRPFGDRINQRHIIDNDYAPSKLGFSPTAITNIFPTKQDAISFLKDLRIPKKRQFDFSL